MKGHSSTETGYGEATATWEYGHVPCHEKAEFYAGGHETLREIISAQEKHRPHGFKRERWVWRINGAIGGFFFCRNVFLEKINIMEHLFGHLQCKMLWREIQQIKWKSTKETNRPSSVTFPQVGLKPINMIAVVKKTPLNMCRQQTCLKWMGENFIKHNFSDIIDASSLICFYRCDKLLSLQHTLDLQ